MIVLVINAGSSSLKYQLFSMGNREVLAKGICERIGIDGHLKHTPLVGGKRVFEEDVSIKDHADAIGLVVDKLTSEEYGVITDMDTIQAVGHRVLHGGQKFSDSVIIDENVIKAIEECVPLGPLHNPANLMGIYACLKIMPGVPQVAVFDTAFHQTMPETSYIYPIPYEYYEKYSVRRYGFHGTSHRYVSSKAIDLLEEAGVSKSDSRVITCHLGNGSSLAAVKGGKCFDTSMGLTPLEGVPMGTRSGSIDPAIVEFIADREDMTIAEMLYTLNHKSGVLGVSGVSSDFRDLEEATNAGNSRAKLAVDIFMYNVKKYIGAYAAAMGGVDAIVFTAGVGENNPAMIDEIASGLGFLGLKLNGPVTREKMKANAVTTADSPVKVFVIPTNEELVIALDTEKLVQKK